MNTKRIQSIFINSKHRTSGTIEDALYHLPDGLIHGNEGSQLKLTVVQWCLNKSFYNVRDGRFYIHNLTTGISMLYTIDPANYNVCSFMEYVRTLIGRRWTFDYDGPKNKYTLQAPEYLYDDNDQLGVREDFHLEFVKCAHLFGLEDGVQYFTNYLTPIISTKTILMNYDNSIFLHCDVPRRHAGASQNFDRIQFHDSSILAAIPIIYAPFDNVSLDMANSFEFYLSTHKVDKIRLWITNQDNELLPLTHDYTCVLKVEHIEIDNHDKNLKALLDVKDTLTYIALHPKLT